MAPAQAATSGTITATGTVPVACSVSGADIAMTKRDPTLLLGTATNVAYTTGSSTTFSFSTPTLAAPGGFAGGGAIYLMKNNTEVAYTLTNGNSNTYTVPRIESGVFGYKAQVEADLALIPGNYTLTTTLTCVGE